MIPSDHEKNGPPYAASDQSSEARGTTDGTLEQLLACAADFDRAAGSSTDAEEWFRAESESLLRWAEKSGKFLLPAEFRQWIDGFKLLEGGLEHQAFFRKRSGRVFKITKPPHFGHTWYLKDYGQNLIRCNLAFGPAAKNHPMGKVPHAPGEHFRGEAPLIRSGELFPDFFG